MLLSKLFRREVQGSKSSAGEEHGEEGKEQGAAAVGNSSPSSRSLSAPLTAQAYLELSALAARQSITSVAVPQYRLRDSYVEYVVECTQGRAAWVVYRRYQQFRALDAALKQLCSRSTPSHSDYGALPVLPGSHWMEVTNQSPELVDRRRRYLELYLQQLLVPRNLFYVARTPLYAFLHDGEVPLTVKTSAIQPLLGLGTFEEELRDPAEVVATTDGSCDGSAASSPTLPTQSSRGSLSSTMKPPPSSSPPQPPAEIVPAGDSEIRSRASSTPPEAIAREETSRAAPEQPVHVLEEARDGLEHGIADLADCSGEDEPSEAEDARHDTGERGPTLASHCLQCHSEFSSCRYPHHCFFCRERFCRHCLRVVRLKDFDNGKAIRACRQCAENYKRRLSRCAAAVCQTSATTPELTPSSAAAYAFMTPYLQPCAPSVLLSDGPTATAESTGISAMAGTASTGAALLSLPGPTWHLPAQVRLHDFRLLTMLGRGTFGKVVKVCYRPTGAVYAMKILSKSAVYKRRMASYINEERAILMSLPPSPYVVRCHFAFQNDFYLFFVFDYLPGGELYDRIYPELKLTAEATRVYTAELVLALEQLHSVNVAHRDVKPENIVLGADGHANLTDFGLARRNFSRSQRRSFVGSAEYVAPEVVLGDVQTTALDWWSLGVLLYEMLAGRAPFHADNNNAVYENVTSRAPDLTLPCFTPEATALIRGLLERDVTKRLQDATQIKSHPYFEGLDWSLLLRKALPAPLTPVLTNNDTRYFRRECTAEWVSIPKPSTTTRESILTLNRCFRYFPMAADDAPTEGGEDAGATINAVGPQSSPESRGTHPRTLSTSLSLPTTMLNEVSAAASHGERGLPSPPLTSAVASTPRISAAGTQSVFSRPPRSPAAPLPLALMVGAWRAVRVEARAADGRVAYPWGGDVIGLLVYLPNGEYSMQLSPTGRRRMRSALIDRATKTELCDLLSSYLAGFGTYTVKEARGYVIHHPEGNLCSNFVSQPMKLFVELSAASATGSATAQGAEPLHGLSGVASGSVSPPLPRTSPPLDQTAVLPLTLIMSTPLQQVTGENFLAQTVVTWERIHTSL